MFDPAYVEHLRKELAHQKRRLEELRDPHTRIKSAHGDEEMRDVTDELIAEKEATVEMYSELLKRVEQQNGR